LNCQKVQIHHTYFSLFSADMSKKSSSYFNTNRTRGIGRTRG
jgi:hypothetical protein